MTYRHFQFFVLACFGLALLAGSSLATQPRITALGGAGDYFEDDTNALRWYGSLGDYDNAVTLDFGHFNIYKGYHDNRENTLSGPSFGARHNLGGNKGTFAATWFAREDDTPTPTLYRNYREEAFSLMYSRLVGEVQLGLIFQNSPEKEKDPASSDWAFFKTRGQLWGLGARWDISPSVYIDLAADLRTSTETYFWPENPPHSTYGEMESERCLNFKGRLFKQLGQRTALVPVVEYLAEERPVPQPTHGYEQYFDGDYLRLGCGLNFFPDTDRFIFIAGQWENGNIHYRADDIIMEESWTTDWNTYSLKVGWETRTLPWMTMRSSVGYTLNRAEGERPTRRALIMEDYDELTYTLGAGFQLPGWDLDAALTSDEPRPVFGEWGPERIKYSRTWLSVSLRYSY